MLPGPSHLLAVWHRSFIERILPGDICKSLLVWDKNRICKARHRAVFRPHQSWIGSPSEFTEFAGVGMVVEHIDPKPCHDCIRSSWSTRRRMDDRLRAPTVVPGRRQSESRLLTCEVGRRGRDDVGHVNLIRYGTLTLANFSY